MPRDKNIPRRNTEACSEPGFSFHERAGRGRRQSYSTDDQFLARFMTCRWQCSEAKEHAVPNSKRTLLLQSLQLACWSMTLCAGVCYVLYIQSPSLSPPEKLLLPAPQVPFKHLYSVNVSHHSPSLVPLGTQNTVLPDLVSRYYNYWLCLRLLFESNCILRALFISHCNPDQCLAHFLSKCS